MYDWRQSVGMVSTGLLVGRAVASLMGHPAEAR